MIFSIMLHDIACIDQENGSLIMEPRIAGRKDQDRLFSELGMNVPDALFMPGSDIAIPFFETLQRVVSMMKEIKKKYPGLQSALGLERIEKLKYRDTLAYYQASPEAKKATFCPLYSGDKCVPTLSNLGYLSKSLIQFGSSTVTDAYIVPPVVRAPGLLLMANSYNSVLTFAIGYYKHTVSRENIEKLLNKIRDELIEECKD